MKKWINWVVLVLIFSVACGFLANWQFARRELKLASIHLIQKNYGTPASEVGSLVALDKFNFPADTWRTLSISGQYLSDFTLLVRNRPNEGQPGFEELVPFKSLTGKIFFVSRGWVSTGANHDYPDVVPQPDVAPTTITARILPEEPILDRTAPKGQIATINIRLAERLTGVSSAVKNGYLRLVSESPLAGAKLKAMPTPSTEEGNNLSYAFQWIMFALMASTTLIWRIRKDTELAKGRVSKRTLKRSELDAQFEDESTTEK